MSRARCAPCSDPAISVCSEAWPVWMPWFPTPGYLPCHGAAPWAWEAVWEVRCVASPFVDTIERCRQ